MGKLEKDVQKEIRKTKLNKAIISALALSGALAVAVVAPNVLGALGKVKFLSQRKYAIKTAFSRMIQKGYITLEKRNGVSYARLTPKGEHIATMFHEGALAPKKPKVWDGKWRLLIFDIPEHKRAVRSKIRIALRAIGFVRLQNSVWAYPYDCEDFIILLKADFKIGKEVLYIIADSVENDSALKKLFKL